MVDSLERSEMGDARSDAAGAGSAPAAAMKRAGQAERDAANQNLYLTGRPKLRNFLRYVRSHAISPPSEGKLIDEWRVAHEIVETLEKEEAGLADGPEVRRPGAEHEPLLGEFLKDPLVRHSFNSVPTEVAFVELDRLVVYQKHIDLSFARLLEGRLGPAPSAERIFRTCLPCDHTKPPVSWSRVHGDRFVFMSPSNDLRFLGPQPIQSVQIEDCPPRGIVVGIVGVAVGFGTNFLNAVYVENRLILNNGSHRAYALRKLGVTHVPCIVQHVSERDELEVVASAEVRRDLDLYLRHPRPPMLRDYFDPKLHMVMPAQRQLRQVTVRFEVEENFVPAP